MGEMMMTHFGLGGPVTMLMSLAIVRSLANNPVSVVIDLKPAISVKQLHERLQREFNAFGKRSLQKSMLEILPRKMALPLIRLTGIPESRPANQISSGERGKIVNILKYLTFNIQAPLPLSRALVTAGGIRLKEIDPLTMSSRLIPGLYFCGEVMEIDGETGGYNLQAAFSTGYLAGESAALFALSGEK
jgi:predicted Rossmann fold flavoprotein